MSDPQKLTIQALGEQEILRRLHRYCPQDLIGDDAAVLSPKLGYEWVITTDLLIDGVHFSDRTTSPIDVGWRAAAVNLSDLAAMGANPIGLTLGLALPATLAWSTLADIYTGITQCLGQYGGVILGGDITRSNTLMISVTALGEVRPTEKILRSAAQVGQVLVATGWHGAARAGLEKLIQPSWGINLSESETMALIQAHQRPHPRLDVINLIRSWPFSCAIAGMDSSDGLADAVLQLCRASQVGAVIEGDRIPIHPALKHTPSLSPSQALDWALYGGEDFELVLALEPTLASALVAQIGNGAAIFGEITQDPAILLREGDRSAPLTFEQTFQHWSS